MNSEPIKRKNFKSQMAVINAIKIREALSSVRIPQDTLPTQRKISVILVMISNNMMYILFVRHKGDG